jgi:hypothetical protein
MTETSGTGDYELPSEVIQTKALSWASATVSIAGKPERVSPQEILRLRAFSTTFDASNYPAAYYAVTGNLLMVWPTPSAADVITLYYVPYPTALSGASDDPSDSTHGGIPAEWHPGIELYAKWQMADSSDDSSSGQGERYRLQYEGDPNARVGSPTWLGYVGRMRAALNRKGGAQRAQFPRGRRGQVFVFNDQRF